MTDTPTVTTLDDIDAAWAASANTPVSEERQQASLEQAAGVPVLVEQAVTTVVLPRGIDGHTEAEIRELTGADEEALGRYKDQLSWFSAVITLGVSRVGSVTLEDKPLEERTAYLGRLLTGERQMLFLAVTAATFGGELDFKVNCQNPSCEAEIEFLVDVMNDLKPEVPEHVPVGTQDFVTRDGRKLGFHLATGDDEAAAMKLPGLSEGERVSLLLENVLDTLNNHIIPDPRGLVKALTIRDRRKLLEVMDNSQPKVDMDVEIECVTCTYKNTYSLRWSDLFRI